LLSILLMQLCTASVRAQELLGLYLTWDSDPTTAMTINWLDLYPRGTLTVYHRAEGSSEWSTTDAVLSTVGPSSIQRRTLQLKGLKPDTVYEFSIGKAPSKPADGWRFRTMPATHSRNIRFISGGDMMHTRELLDAMNQHIAPLDADFAIFGGDLAYEDGVRALRFIDFFASWRQHGMTADRRLIPVIPVIGNHEVRGGYNGKIPDDAAYYYGLFTLPGGKSMFTLDFGEYLSIIALDSGHTHPIDGEQTQWLDDALKTRAKSAHLFPVYHFPAYGTSKAPENQTPLDNARAKIIRQHWTPLFDRHGVSAVFENDHHTYKRTFPIRAEKRDDANGIVYVGDGAWGVRTRPVPKVDESWWLAKAESRNHFWVVDLPPDQAPQLRAMDNKGQVFDEYTLSRPRTLPDPKP
jgi:hypothetical protein